MPLFEFFNSTCNELPGLYYPNQIYLNESTICANNKYDADQYYIAKI